jgi:CHAD domain-containing protein
MATSTLNPPSSLASQAATEAPHRARTEGRQHFERVYTLTAEPEWRVPDSALDCGDLRPAPPRTLHLETTYYDTADLSLARAGVTMRYRSGEAGQGWRLKLPGRTFGDAPIRRVVRYHEPQDAVPAEALDLLHAYLRGAAVRSVARLVTNRTTIALSDRSGTTLAEVVDDHVSVYREADHRSVFREIEIHVDRLDRRGDDLLHALARSIVKSGARATVPTPKVLRTLGISYPGPDTADRHNSDCDVIGLLRQNFRTSMSRLIAADVGTRMSDDDESTHEMRVTARRLRVTLKTFAAVLDPSWSDKLSADLRWLGDVAGAVRDTDVLARRIRSTMVANLRGLDEATASGLLIVLRGEHDAARRRLVEALGSPRYTALLTALSGADDAITVGPQDASSVDRRMRHDLVHALHADWRRVRDAANSARVSRDSVSLHRVRILSKRCRYAAEAVAPLLGQPAASLAESMSDLQAVLGEYNDTVVAERWLRLAARHQPETGIAAGIMIVALCAERRRLDKAWVRRWHAVSRRDPASAL